MINRIVVVPRQAIEGYQEKPTWLESNFKFMGHVAIISIHSYMTSPLVTKEFEERLKKTGCVDFLSLMFGDLSYNEVKTSEDLQKQLFTVGQAHSIIQFLNEIKKGDLEILICQCDAGVSRSGAVGIFACRYLGLDERIFRAENYNIAPNSYIYDILYKESGLRQKYYDFWLDEAWKNMPADPDIERMFS